MGILLLISKVIDPVIYTVMVIPRKLLSFWPAFSRQLISACMTQAPSYSRRLRPVATTVPRAFTRTVPMEMPPSRAPVRASSSAVIMYSSMTAPHMSRVQAGLRANHPSAPK